MENETESNDIQVSNDQDESTIENEKKKYEEEKQILLKQINELQQFINEAELSLHSVKYGDIQIKNKTELVSFDSKVQTSLSSKTITPYVDMEYELYKLAGLYCTKSTNNEFVFNVSASSNEENSSAVQFFVEDDEVTLGNWVMPIGITIDYILAETPLEKPIHVIPFLRNCKRHVLCYEQRKQQFDQFKKSLATITNCKVTANFGYLAIAITFNQVTNKQTNQNINCTVNLFYNSGKVRPHTLKINSPSEELSSHLRNYIKKFKKDILQDAYNSIVTQSHAIFEWKPEVTTETELIRENHQTVLENNEDSEDDSDFNVKKRKRGRKQRKTPVKKINVDSINSENNSDDSEHEENKSATESVPRKKSVTRRTSKKSKVTAKKVLPKIIQSKVVKTKNTEDVLISGDQDKNVKSSEAEKVVESLQKPRKAKSRIPVKQNTKKRTSANPPEKNMNVSTISTRFKQVELRSKNPNDIKKSELKENSISKKRKTHTSTPMAGNIKRMKQLVLNLSPIPQTIDTVGKQDLHLRKGPRKKKNL